MTTPANHIIAHKDKHYTYYAEHRFDQCNPSDYGQDANGWLFELSDMSGYCKLDDINAATHPHFRLNSHGKRLAFTLDITPPATLKIGSISGPYLLEVKARLVGPSVVVCNPTYNLVKSIGFVCDVSEDDYGVFLLEIMVTSLPAENGRNFNTNQMIHRSVVDIWGERSIEKKEVGAENPICAGMSNPGRW